MTNFCKTLILSTLFGMTPIMFGMDGTVTASFFESECQIIVLSNFSQSESYSIEIRTKNNGSFEKKKILINTSDCQLLRAILDEQNTTADLFVHTVQLSRQKNSAKIEATGFNKIKGAFSSEDLIAVFCNHSLIEVHKTTSTSQATTTHHATLEIKMKGAGVFDSNLEVPTNASKSHGISSSYSFETSDGEDEKKPTPQSLFQKMRATIPAQIQALMGVALAGAIIFFLLKKYNASAEQFISDKYDLIMNAFMRNYSRA